ncbi:MAG: tetratricopeptide repeat protein, partial [Fibrobacter sp.]|nr:tetratricopeptide repeat protein [Fibrobacter sp.]
DLNNDFSVPDFSESENSNDSLQNNTSNDVFISMSDTSDSMQASEDNDFTTFRNIIAGEEQSEDPLQSENLSFDYNLPEEQQTDSAPMQTADSEGAYEASDDIFNTSPMDLLHRRDEEADGLLPQINESEDSLEVKTSVFNNDTQNDFEYLDNSLENIEQPSLQESNVQSHITENTGSENDIFKDDSAGMLVVNETTTPDTSDNTTDSEFIDLMESVQTAEPAEDSFDFDSIQNPSPEDTLSEMSTLQELPEDAFEPQISGSDGDNDLVLDYYSSTDAVNLPDSNPISTENHSEEKSTDTELNIDSMLLSEEFSGSSDNDPKLYSIDDSTDNYMQTASLNQPLTTDSISDNLNEPMVEAEQVEPGTDFIQHYDNQSYQQSVTENSENQDIFDSQSDPASLQVDMNGTLPDTFTDDSSENNTSTPLQSGAEEDVQVEYDEDVISEMDVLVTDSPLGIVSGDDVADKLDQIFSKNNPGSIKEQPANQTGNQAMEQNVSNQQEIYSSDEPVAESTSDYFDNQTDPSSIVPDNEVPSFESYVQASSQFTPEDTGDESSIDHYNSGLQYADNINEPEITTELTGHSPETIPENSISSYSNTPVITAQDLEDRLEEFFPDEDLTLHSQDTDFVDNEDDEDNSEAGGFYTIYGDDAVNSEPLDNLQGIDEVEIVNPIDPASLQDEAGSFYQEWNDACNADEQLTTETIAITPPKNFTGSEATDTFSKTTMTDEDDLSAKPYSIPDHVLTPTLADIYYQQGQYDLAIQIYSRLLEKDPENDTIRIRLQSIQESFEQSNSGTRTPLHTQSEKADPPLKKRKPPVDNRPLAGVRIKKKPKRSTNR